jgi:hypothetical protein
LTVQLARADVSGRRTAMKKNAEKRIVREEIVVTMPTTA